MCRLWRVVCSILASDGIAATIRFRFSHVAYIASFFMSSNSHFEIRSATLRDAKAIADIHVNASRGAGFAPSDPFAILAADKRQAHWREAIEYSEPQVMVALDAGQIIGFVGFDRSRDAGTPPTTGEIWALYLTPAYQGKGAGLALWDAAREGLLEEGCSQVTLWLPLANERALRFFELAGFKRQMNSIRTVPIGGVRIEEMRLKRTLT